MPRFSSSKSFEQIKKPRKLPERSNLSFEFPQSDNRYFKAYVPFLSNPIISERGQANLIEYDLVGRAGTFYGYGGAKSRTINLQFKINLLHMLYSNVTEGIADKFLRSFNLFFADKERAAAAFKLKPKGYHSKRLAEGEAGALLTSARQTLANENLQAINNAAAEGPENYVGVADPVGFAGSDFTLGLEAQAQGGALNPEFVAAQDELAEAAAERYKAKQVLAQLQSEAAEDEELTSNRDPDIKYGKGFEHAATHRSFYREIIGILTGSPGQELPTPVVDGVANFFLEATGSNAIPTPQDNLQNLNKMIDLVYVWVNLIRSSTLNRADNTTFGPPIVRLQHGPMYNNVPFVVTDYNIQFNESAGYELETLTPKEIDIQMTLKEFRTNGSFTEGQIESGDHLAGWESVIKNNNIDPYNGDIGLVEQYAADKLPPRSFVPTPLT